MTKHVPPYQASEADWQDFFEGWDIPEGTTYPVDKNRQWLRMAGKHGSVTFQQTDERLVEQA